MKEEAKAGLENDDRRLQQRLLDRIGELSREMEKYNLAGYISALNNPRRYVVVNFVGGIARGLGIAVGATFLGALVLYFLQRLVVLNLPLIGDFIADLIRIVHQNM